MGTSQKLVSNWSWINRSWNCLKTKRKWRWKRRQKSSEKSTTFIGRLKWMKRMKWMKKRENVSMFYGWIWQQRKYLAPLTNFNFNLPTKWRTNIQWSMLSPRSFVSLTALPFIGWLNGRSIGRDQSEMNSIKDQKKNDKNSIEIFNE